MKFNPNKIFGPYTQLDRYSAMHISRGKLIKINYVNKRSEYEVHEQTQLQFMNGFTHSETDRLMHLGRNSCQ